MPSEYAQAFEFDQLHTLMKKNAFFAGFHEAPINFPPTFKYDVLRTLKRSKRTSSKVSRIGDQTPLTEAEERDNEDDEDDEGASLLSSAISTVSKPPTEPGNDNDTYFYTSPSTPTVGTSTSKVSIASTGASKAKAKWLSLLSPSLGGTPKLPKPKHAESWASGPLTPKTPMSPLLIPPSPLSSSHPNTPDVGKRRFLRPPPMILLNVSGSQNSIAEDADTDEKGVYDSSNKKRVPSWYVVASLPFLCRLPTQRTGVIAYCGRPQ